MDLNLLFSDILLSYNILPPSNDVLIEKKRHLKKIITDSQEKIIREQNLPNREPVKVLK